MATYNLNTKDVLGTAATTIGAYRSDMFTANAKVVEAVLDVGKLIENGYTQVNNDVFELLKIPAGNLVVAAGAEVMTAFDGTSVTVDIDFAGGDDIVDGGDVSAAGFLASGTNGQANVVTTGAASTFTQFVSTEDTIDVTLTNSATDVTTGVLRVYALVVDMNEYGGAGIASEVVRDQLA